MQQTRLNPKGTEWECQSLNKYIDEETSLTSSFGLKQNIQKRKTVKAWCIFCYCLSNTNILNYSAIWSLKNYSADFPSIKMVSSKYTFISVRYTHTHTHTGLNYNGGGYSYRLLEYG